MQTARGASLTGDADPTETHATARRRSLVLFAAVTVLGYLADLISKVLVVAHLTPGRPVHVVGDLLTLYLARNPGAAFSTGTSYTLVLSFVAMAAAVAVVWVARRLASTGWALGLGFLLAGVLGNLTDRIFREPGPLRGHVVDFIRLPHWPIFNIADVCINVAAAFIIIQALRGVGINGARQHQGRDRLWRRYLGVTEYGTDRRTVMVPEGLAGERLDAAIARMFGLSRTRVADLIARGQVSVDGEVPAKSDRVQPGALLVVEIPALVDPVAVVPETVDGIKILHDDEAIVVIDKPVGVAVHPSPGWTGPTVVGHLVAAGFQVATSGAAERQGIVQRLDVGTSGVMVVAKSERAYSVLKNAFRERTVDKVYHALVQGHPDPLRGTVDAPIGRHPKYDYKFAVLADGKHSVTHYETLEAHRFASLLEVHLETGRTHQIRVHMAALKHPCVGDLTYGADPVLARRLHLERQWLHAVRLGFEHPESGEYVSFESSYPADLRHALAQIRDET